MKGDVVNLDLEHDPVTRAEIMAARAWGVSWSRFSGQEPISVTTYHYDDAGHLIGAATVREPEWTDQDREAAIALQEYEAGLCPGCQEPMSETTDPANEGRYRTDLPIRCHRCTMAEIARDVHQDKPQASALFVPIRLAPVVPEATSGG